MDLSLFPPINASLNAASASFLVAGFILIRRKAVSAHRLCMLAACAASTLFLASYLYYHSRHGATPFPGQGVSRFLYFSILISHSLLAVVIAPLIFTTLFWALKGRFDRHRHLARITLPLWLYVSVTGVVVYWMLYRTHY